MLHLYGCALKCYEAVSGCDCALGLCTHTKSASEQRRDTKWREGREKVNWKSPLWQQGTMLCVISVGWSMKRAGLCCTVLSHVCVYQNVTECDTDTSCEVNCSFHTCTCMSLIPSGVPLACKNFIYLFFCFKQVSLTFSRHHLSTTISYYIHQIFALDLICNCLVSKSA